MLALFTNKMYLSLSPVVSFRCCEGIRFPTKNKYIYVIIFNSLNVIITSFCSSLMQFANHIKARKPPTAAFQCLEKGLLCLCLHPLISKGSVHKTMRITGLLIKKLLITKFCVKSTKFDRFIHGASIFNCRDVLTKQQK